MLQGWIPDIVYFTDIILIAVVFIVVLLIFFFVWCRVQKYNECETHYCSGW